MDYFDYWRQERKRRELISQQQIAKARANLPGLIKILVQRFQVTKIILFGSLVQGSFDPESDIDIAVENLAPQDFFRAYTALNVHSPFPVDLKPLEDLDSSFRSKVERIGECLYEKNNSSNDR